MLLDVVITDKGEMIILLSNSFGCKTLCLLFSLSVPSSDPEDRGLDDMIFRDVFLVRPKTVQLISSHVL